MQVTVPDSFHATVTSSLPPPFPGSPQTTAWPGAHRGCAGNGARLTPRDCERVCAAAVWHGAAPG
eukprot:263546-Chlamydomonas_euryale.AAC.1